MHDLVQQDPVHQPFHAKPALHIGGAPYAGQAHHEIIRRTAGRKGYGPQRQLAPVGQAYVELPLLREVGRAHEVEAEALVRWGRLDGCLDGRGRGEPLAARCARGPVAVVAHPAHLLDLILLALLGFDSDQLLVLHTLGVHALD